MSIAELMVHSDVGPSGGDRWMNCPGSVPATAHLPDTTSEFAAEGIFAHYITELARNQNNDANYYHGFTSEDGVWTCDKEMVIAVQDFLDYVDQWEGDVFVEQRVSYDAWVENGFGTSDHICINAEKRHCLVNDFKYGKGIQIFAKGNNQGKLYALGVFQDYGHLYDIDNFTIAISQPRIKHRDQWNISTEKLLKWAEDVVEPAGLRVEEAQQKLLAHGEIPDEYFKAGGWCQWCKIKGDCKARAAMIRESVLIGIDDIEYEGGIDDPGEEQPLVSNPAIMSDVELGESAKLVDQIKKWCTDVTAVLKQRVMARARIASGVDEDGETEFWKMVTGRANRKWFDEVKAAAALKRAKLKADEVAPRKIISPAQAENLIGADHKVLIGMIEKPQGAPVLVEGSDKRKPYKVSTDELDDVDDEDDNDTSWLDD